MSKYVEICSYHSTVYEYIGKEDEPMHIYHNIYDGKWRTGYEYGNGNGYIYRDDNAPARIDSNEMFTWANNHNTYKPHCKKL